MQMCILLYYWANKMMMMMMNFRLKCPRDILQVLTVFWTPHTA